MTIFLVTQTFEEFNKTGIDNLFLYVAQSNSWFIPLILIGVFFIILISIYSGTKAYKGVGDITTSFVASSLITLLLTIILNMKEGLINQTIWIFVIGITAISVLILFFSGKRE